MRNNRFALPFLAMLLLVAVGLPARAACTAGSPNSNVIESTPTSGFTDNGDGTITHLKTGLMWKRCAEGQTWNGSSSTCTGNGTTFLWADALKAANNAAFGGHTDWRLPNIMELQSIVENCGYGPAINQTAFPANPTSLSATSPFWSSSSTVADPSRAWLVYFGDGETQNGLKNGDIFVRLVRGGQSLDSFDLLAESSGTPQCTLSASPGTIAAGQTSILTATCNPAATSYVWTNTGFAATASTGTVSPTVTTSYSVIGSNAAGSGNTASATVTVTTCTYSLLPTTQIVTGIAATGTVSVTAAAGCAWAASSNVPWIAITSGGSGSGNGTVVYAVAANPLSTARTGTLTIAGQTFTVTQAGAAPVCTLTASPGTIAAGQSSVLTATCTPAANSYAWTNTNFGAAASSGVVSPTVTTTYSVTGGNAAGSGNPASVTVTVTCTSLSTSSQSVGASATAGTLSVTAASGCAWTASSNVEWITITSGASGNGNGSVGYSVAANPSGSSRIGIVTIGGRTVTVTQAGAVPTCTLIASPAAITAGQSSILTAACNPDATSYSWTNTGFAPTASTGSVSPAVTTTYSVIGSNAAGSGNAISATVAVLTPAFIAQSNCLFGWAERNVPSFFAPAGAISGTFAQYYYRYYPQTSSFLATSFADDHVYYLGPLSGNSLFDLGALSGWLAAAACQ